MEIDLWSSINVGAERTPPLRKMGKLWGADRDRRPGQGRESERLAERKPRERHSLGPTLCS